MAAPRIRPARDDDGPGLIALIGACFAEYPGCVLDVDGEIPDLRGVASAYAADGGAFWVAERDNLVVGSVGWTPVAMASRPHRRRWLRRR